MNWIKRYLAPTLLAIVAAAQLVAVHTSKLSRWEGGGFGMYSELPPNTRRVDVDLSGSQKPLTQSTRKRLESATDRFEAIPSARSLDAIATVLRDSGISNFQIDAWAESFDLDAMQVTVKRIGQRSSPKDPP